MQTSKLLYESKPTWSDEFQIKGREEGRKKGRKEGLEQGKADMLLRLLMGIEL